MHSTLAFSEVYTATTAPKLIAPVQDTNFTIQNNGYIVTKQNKVIGSAAAIDTDGLRAELVTPSLRAINYANISSLSLTTDIQALFDNMYHPDVPIPLTELENLQLQVTSSGGSTARKTAIVHVTDQELAPVKGLIIPVRAQITVAKTVGAWALGSVSFPAPLEQGDYAVVGARMVDTDMVAVRFVPVGSLYRPGFFPVEASTDLDPYWQRYGNMGIWFTFATTQLPQVEVFALTTAASATYELILDILVSGQ